MADGPAELEKKISDCAYFLWEKAGRPDYREKEFWETAERSITQMTLMDDSDFPGKEQYSLVRRAAVLPKKIGTYPEELRRKHQRTRVRTALRLARPKLNEWRASEFIHSLDRERYSLQFLHAIRPILENEIVQQHWQKLFKWLFFFSSFSYFIFLPSAIPEHLNHVLPEIPESLQSDSPTVLFNYIPVGFVNYIIPVGVYAIKALTLAAIGEILTFIVFVAHNGNIKDN